MLTSPRNILPNRLAPPRDAPMIFRGEGSLSHVSRQRRESGERLGSLATDRETQMRPGPILPQTRFSEDELDSGWYESPAAVQAT